MGFIIAHIYFHFQWKNWIERFRKLKSHVTPILAIFWALTFLTGIAAFILWLVHGTHSHLGGWHGKIGFIFIAIAIGHTIKRIKYYKSKRK